MDTSIEMKNTAKMDDQKAKKSRLTEDIMIIGEKSILKTTELEPLKTFTNNTVCSTQHQMSVVLTEPVCCDTLHLL